MEMNNTGAGFQPQPTVIASAPPLGCDSQATQCRYCNNQIRTLVTSEPTTKTHLIALVLCLLGCWPCCIIPYCMNSCQNQKHTCPNCGAFLGQHQN